MGKLWNNDAIKSYRTEWKCQNVEEVESVIKPLKNQSVGAISWQDKCFENKWLEASKEGWGRGRNKQSKHTRAERASTPTRAHTAAITAECRPMSG